MQPPFADAEAALAKGGGMGNGNHNTNCATAGRPGCACSGCGGSQHGYQGWLGLVERPDDRTRNRTELEDRWATSQRGRAPSGKGAQVIGADLARLDVADWLAAEAGTNRSMDFESPVPGRPTGATEALQTGVAAPPHPTAVEQVTTLAEAMARDTWPDLSAELDRTAASPTAVKKQLACHVWCDLLVGLIQVIEETREALDQIPAEAKVLLKEAILDSSMQGLRAEITSEVVDLVVDRVWPAFQSALFANVPLLSVLTDEEALRSLRILAVFICPAPAEHKEVHVHAVKPLGDDAREVLTDQTKALLASLFQHWQVPVH